MHLRRISSTLQIDTELIHENAMRDTSGHFTLTLIGYSIFIESHARSILKIVLIMYRFENIYEHLFFREKEQKGGLMLFATLRLLLLTVVIS